MSEFTKIMRAAESGDPHAAEKLLPLVYGELRKLAAAHLASEQSGHTMQPTALVHEAYLRLTGAENNVEWKDRKHFFGAAAIAIRRILIENARQKQCLKRGGRLQRRFLVDDEVPRSLPEPREDLMALDDALCRFSEVHAQAADLVQLLYFVGLTLSQAAEVIGVSTRTAGRLWAYARAWLRREIEDSNGTAQNS